MSETDHELDEALRRLTNGEPSPGLRDRVMARISARRARAPIWSGTVARLALAGGTLAVALAGLVFWTFGPVPLTPSSGRARAPESSRPPTLAESRERDSWATEAERVVSSPASGARGTEVSALVSSAFTDSASTLVARSPGSAMLADGADAWTGVSLAISPLEVPAMTAIKWSEGDSIDVRAIEISALEVRPLEVVALSPRSR